MPEILGGTPEADAARRGIRCHWAEQRAPERATTRGTAKLAVEAVLGLGEGGFAREPPALEAMQLDNAPAFAVSWNAPEPRAMTCEELGTVRAPTLIVTGAKTLPAFTETAEAVAACLPGAETASMDGVGHGGPVEAADAFGELALGFIGRGVTPSGRSSEASP